MKKDNPPVLAIVCPCYNEEETLVWSVNKLLEKRQSLIDSEAISHDSFIVLVDDGSIDATWSFIEQSSSAHPSIIGIKLAGNAGHQNALTAGLHYVTDKCDCAVSTDIDLQHDINAIDDMLHCFQQGKHIVFGVCCNRSDNGFFKRVFSQGFYRLLNGLGVRSIYNHADYRLLSNMVLRIFKQMPESNLYLRGLFANLQLPQESVFYELLPRAHGKTKYTLAKMLSLAWTGISSFSVVPLRLIALLGLIVFFITLLISGYVLWVKWFTDMAVPGWASTVIPIYLLGGLQLFSIGIVGEYIGKIFIEVKQRPRYVIEKKTVDSH